MADVGPGASPPRGPQQLTRPPDRPTDRTPGATGGDTVGGLWLGPGTGWDDTVRRLLLPLLVGLMLVAGSAPAAAATATAPPVDYVALGDSYAAGVGAQPDGRSGDCRRSDRSYPARWAAAHDPASFVSVACSGATAGEVLVRQVRTVSRNTDLVTLTVGGNDIGFAPVLGICSTAQRDQDCQRAVTGGERITRYALPSAVVPIIAGVRLQASPNVRVVVMGYPRLFEPGPDCATPLVPNAARRAALNRAADTLNAVLRDAAGRWRAEFVDVTPAFAGHGVCSADPWINPPTDPPQPGSYHPTSRGYARGYLPALTGALDRA